MTETGAQLFEELMRFRPDGLSPNAWAVKAGVSRTIWQDLRRHGNPSRRTLEKLLSAAGSSLAEFEALRMGQAAPGSIGNLDRLAETNQGWKGAWAKPIPLLETSLAGEWGEAGSGIAVHSINRALRVGEVDRPAALAGDLGAYAVAIPGNSMWPRFRADRRLLVSSAAGIAVGDDVLVQLAGGKALIKELVGKSATLIELRQFNPDVTFEADAGAIVAIHKIVGEAL